MTTLDLRGASTTIRGTAGTDMSVSITFTDPAGDPVDVSGYTAAADVLRGTAVVDSFASAVSGAGNNILTLTLTDTETLAIGSERRLRWRLSMTAGGVTEQWISGAFELSAAGEPAAGSGSSVSVSVAAAVNATISLSVVGGGGGAVDSVNGQIGVVALDAGDIPFTPVGTIAATDVQAAIAEVASEAAAPVDSVNGQTGVVVLDADDIDDTLTIHKFATSAQLALADTAIQPTDGLADLDSDAATKLAGIETGADVTDAANVSTAGGLIVVAYNAGWPARPSVSGPVMWVNDTNDTAPTADVAGDIVLLNEA